MSGHTATVVVIGMAVLIGLSGCAEVLPGDGGNGAGAETATVSLFLSDQPNAIDDFQHLNVTVTRVGFKQAENDTWANQSVDEATLDLTELQGDRAALLGNLSIPAGQYSKVFIHVSQVNGTLTDGSSAAVKLPSSKLQLSKNFAVDPDEELSFVYDVGVHQTGGGKYIIKPQVGESGPNKPVKRVDGKAKGKPDGKPDGKNGGKNRTTTTTTTTTTAGGGGQGQDEGKQGSMAMPPATSPTPS